MQVLEFGCGTGSTALTHAPYVKHIRATDASANMIQIARHKAQTAQVHNVSFEQTAIEDISAPESDFDAVLGLSILHLLQDKEAVIAKVHTMLKPGGVFVSSTACLGDMLKLWRLILSIRHFLRVIPEVKFFTSDQLEHSLTTAGFQIEQRWQPAKAKAVFIVASKADG